MKSNDTSPFGRSNICCYISCYEYINILIILLRTISRIEKHGAWNRNPTTDSRGRSSSFNVSSIRGTNRART